MILSTTEKIPNREITEILGISRGSTVRARNVGRDIMAGFKNLVGGEIDEYTKLQAQSREEAIQLMIEAINNYKVEGVLTTLPFGKFVCEHEAFRSGNFDTHFVKNYYTLEKLKEAIEEEAKLAALIGLKIYIEDQKQLRIPAK